jgi:hypothetical protein
VKPRGIGIVVASGDSCPRGRELVDRTREHAPKTLAADMPPEFSRKKSHGRVMRDGWDR